MVKEWPHSSGNINESLISLLPLIILITAPLRVEHSPNLFYSSSRSNKKFMLVLRPKIRPSISIPTLHQHLCQQLVESGLIFDRFIGVGWHSADYQPTVDQGSIGMSIEYWSKSRVSIESIDRHWTVLIFSAHDSTKTTWAKKCRLAEETCIWKLHSKLSLNVPHLAHIF